MKAARINPASDPQELTLREELKLRGIKPTGDERRRKRREARIGKTAAPLALRPEVR